MSRRLLRPRKIAGQETSTDLDEVEAQAIDDGSEVGNLLALVVGKPFGADGKPKALQSLRRLTHLSERLRRPNLIRSQTVRIPPPHGTLGLVVEGVHHSSPKRGEEGVDLAAQFMSHTSRLTIPLLKLAVTAVGGGQPLAGAI